MVMEYGIVLCGIAFVLLLVSNATKTPGKSGDAARLARIEAKLDLLLKHAGIEHDPYKNVPPGIAEALERGEKILAIKLYREMTGAGLKEAKDRVEEIQMRSDNLQ